MKLSVIIVNYNVKYFLEQALQSVRKAVALMKQESGFDTEVLVVDNNSVDGSIEILRKKFPEVHLIANKDNKGFSVANNQAIKISKGEYKLLLNPDTVVEEDTFLKTVNFMDEHPEAGGLGVKMIDGKGKFLPESKRGFPTPFVAFCKVFGLSFLFPKSKIFGKYHLGFLDHNNIHKIEVLAGAFMMLRKEALEKAGLLDENFFMYGEDIDLSYRIKQAGYENYYFPDTRIIHYKGESTKKSSVSYVVVFYKAMVIFAKKHFSKKNARIFSFLIYIAIYLRAGISLFRRYAEKAALPLLDIVFLYATLIVLKSTWLHLAKPPDWGQYPIEVIFYNLPVYTLLWIIGAWFSGNYNKPFRFSDIFTGIVWGTILVAVLYAFMPESLRFSRALILLGALSAFIVFSINRLLWQYFTEGNFNIGKNSQKNIIVIGKHDEGERVLEILNNSGLSFKFTGFVAPDDKLAKDNKFLGHSGQLSEIVWVHNVQEIVFCSRDLPIYKVINWMIGIKKPDLKFKIVPDDSIFAIGSNSKDLPGEFYSVDIKLALAEPGNRLNKRVLDILISFGILLTYPLMRIYTQPHKNLLKNVFKVISGKYSWVGDKKGYLKQYGIKPGILSPAGQFNNSANEIYNEEKTAFLYAKDYALFTDIEIFFKGLKKTGV